jgi:very-short-patch-repair endonuclease
MGRTTNPLTRTLATGFRRSPTAAEAATWELLRGRRCLGLKFRRQYPVRGFVVDFYCASLRLAIELDGGVHDDPAAKGRDTERTTALNSEGIQVLRLRNEQVSADNLAKLISPYLPGRRWR